MNQKRIFFLLILLLVLGGALQASIAFTPYNPKTGQEVTFTLAPAFMYLVPAEQLTWKFGDGVQIVRPITELSTSHAYAVAGTYSVTVHYHDTYAGPQNETIVVVVTAAPVKTISFSPGDPVTCEPVIFQAANFVSSLLRWEFGDGTVQTGGSVVASHSYTSVGSFVVKVYDNNGSDVNPASTMVQVSEKRTLALLTAQPKTGMPVSFQASGFISACLRWDFGDGQPPVNGTAAATHVYAKPGQFQVTASDDCGAALCSASVSVTVEASMGPLALFSISYASLRFENGTTNVSVAKNTSGLIAYADLKFEGSGILQVEWRVDGQLFKTTTQSLGFAGQATIDSGKIPGLPTNVLGPHAVALSIVKPQAAFTVPAMATMIPPPPPPPPMFHPGGRVDSGHPRHGRAQKRTRCNCWARISPASW